MPDGFGGFVRHYEIPALIEAVAPVYVKFGLRNAPDIYPSGLHLENVAVLMARERVRRAELGLALLQRQLEGARRRRRCCPRPHDLGPVRRARCTRGSRGGALVRITQIETFLVGTEWRNFTICRVHTDTGLTGLGESRIPNHPHALEAYARAAARHIVGRDPFDIESLVMRMRRDDYSRAGEIMSSGIALFEMACWDIVGKALQQPVYRLLGGKVRDRIRAYANGWYRVERTPEQFHAAAMAVVCEGYTALKFDPFGPGYYEIDVAERRRVVALVEAVRDGDRP